MKVISKLIVFLSLLFFCGCSTLQGYFGGGPTGKNVSYHEHIVQHRGETLAVISSWYTGKVNNWNVIKNHNPNLDIRKIQIGQKIFIPKYIINKNQPLPQDYVKRWEERSHKVAFVSMKRDINSNTLSYTHGEMPTSSATFLYNVQSIKGCERFKNSPLGLQQCANFMNNESEMLIKVHSNKEKFR
jgi:LysM repeat protein